MGLYQSGGKRALDLAVAVTALLISGWLLALGWIAARISTGSGFFIQDRVGRDGMSFRVIKLQTMLPASPAESTATASTNPRITRVGGWLRRSRIDELPQFWNVLRGDMSLVGPRPDVAGFADKLEGDDRAILKLRPGITGPATLAFHDEEALLASMPDPDDYNSTVIWPAKVRINRCYVDHCSLGVDLRLLAATAIPALRLRVVGNLQSEDT